MNLFGALLELALGEGPVVAEEAVAVPNTTGIVLQRAGGGYNRKEIRAAAERLRKRRIKEKPGPVKEVLKVAETAANRAVRSIETDARNEEASEATREALETLAEALARLDELTRQIEDDEAAIVLLLAA